MLVQREGYRTIPVEERREGMVGLLAEEGLSRMRRQTAAAWPCKESLFFFFFLRARSEGGGGSGSVEGCKNALFVAEARRAEG